MKDEGPGGEIVYKWRGDASEEEVAAVLADAFSGPVERFDTVARIRRHSLGWITARDGSGMLVGFVNLAWDGGLHATIFDTAVLHEHHRRGIGTRLVRLAIEKAREAGCLVVHVDFESHLRSFYLDSCGFRPTEAGIVDGTSGT
jgi:predicted N-acetyltransferase YhbS